MAGNKRRALIVAICVIVLFVGAYFFGTRVSVPLRARMSEGRQEARTVLGQEAEAPVAPVAALAASLVKGAAKESPQVPVSFFLADVQYLDMDATIQMLHNHHATALTVPLVWSMLEPERGAYTMEAYVDRLDRFAREGFKFIFLIDGAARRIVRDGEVVGRSVPDWVYAEAGAIPAMDFTGATSGENGPMSYAYAVNRQLYLDFARQTLEAFGQRYSGNVLGFAPAVMPEFEIKHPQENFAWNDYSEAGLEGFRSYERERYGSIDRLNAALGTQYLNFGELLMPVINYNNSIAGGALNDAPIFVEYQRYREQLVLDYVAPAFDLIHEKGYETFAYFGQVLHPHDGIYASGVAVRLADRVDTAVIDYNFYDGYDVVLDSAIPAMMTNYLKNAGYPRVWTGIYLERIDYHQNVEFIQETIDYAAASGCCDGLELGSIPLDAGGDPGVLCFGAQKREDHSRVAIYVSEWNFYHSHGEAPAFINYFSDSITQMYKLIQFELGIDVDLLCDEAVLNGKLDQYDLLVVPGQFYVADEVRKAIEAYLKQGGRGLQDFRFGEWNEYGQNTGSWCDDCFDIAGREALHQEEILAPVDPVFQDLQTVIVSAPYGVIPNIYAIAGATEDSRYLFKDESGRRFGVRTDNTICLCCQPQIQYKYAQTEEERQACVQLVRLAIEALLPPAESQA